MKLAVLLLSLVSQSLWANVVVDPNGSPVVLFKQKTIQMVDQILNCEESDTASKIKRMSTLVLAYETSAAPIGEEKFCETVARFYVGNKLTAEKLLQKCPSVLKSNDFIGQLVEDTPPYQNLEDLNLQMSRYFKALITFTGF